MTYLKIIAALALTSGIVSLSPADDDQAKTAADSANAGNTAADKTAVDKKLDKPLQEKKAARKSEKNAQGGMREEVQAYMEKLSPEDRARLKELHQQDPEKFRKEIRSKMVELRKQEGGSQKNLNGIAEKYSKAKTPEEKQKYLAQLKETSKKEFYRNLERSKTELDALEKRLSSLRQAYENRKNNADKIIDDQVEYLTRDSSLHW